MAKKKKKKQDRQRHTRPASRQPVRAAARAIDQAMELARRGRVGEAVSLLQETDRKHPGEPEVLVALAELAMRTEQANTLLDAAVKLARLRPNEAAAHGLLGTAYLRCNFLHLALRTFQGLLARWPNDPHADLARTNVAAIEATLASVMADLVGDRPDAEELLLQHELVQVELGRMRFAEARRRAEELLRRWPDFIPTRNNLAEACFHAGQLHDAVAAAREAVERAPDNTHAAANLTRLLVLSGRFDEARQAGERLRHMAVQRAENRVKLAEAFSFLGDDQAVLDAWRAAAQDLDHIAPDGVALLHHLAAVAFLRQGDEDRARLVWRDCLRAAPGFDLAVQNLEDLDRPVAERSGPWGYSLQYWLPRSTFDQLVRRTTTREMSDARLRQEFRLFFQDHPEVPALIPLLLDRSDPMGRQMAFMFASVARTPETLAALRDFALGQRGPDSMRMQAATIASEEQLLGERVRMWSGGEWRDLQLFGFQITGEPRRERKHNPEVERLAREAALALNAGEGVRAERLGREALAREPDAPDLLNNLANALAVQGREVEAEQMIRDLHARCPDYLFAAVQLARIEAQRGNIDEADQLLRPFTQRKELHVSEFRALAAAQIHLCLARKDRHGAEQWLQMLERAAPDDINLPILRADVRGTRRGWR